MESTALNQLLEWLNEFENKPIKPTYTNMKEKIWQLLPVEEKQLRHNTNTLPDLVDLLPEKSYHTKS